MSLGEDNRLSILIQAKIDEASTKTMQDQLDTLSKNLKAVKISLNLGDVEGQFVKLTREIQKESAKMFVNDGVKIEGLEKTKKSIQELRKESEKAFQELDKLGEVKGVKNMVVDSKAGTKSFQAEISSIKDGMEYIQKVNVFGQLNKETKEWEFSLEKAGSSMKRVLSSFNYNEYTANINKYFKEYQKGFMTVEDYFDKLKSLMKKTGSDEFIGTVNNLPDDVKKSMIAHYTEIETKATEHKKKMEELQKRNQSFGSLDESIDRVQKLGSEMDSIYNKMKRLGEIKSLDEKFDGEGNLTGYKVQIEEIKDGFKILQNYNVIGKLKEDTNEWEYAIEKAGSKVKEVNKILNSTDFAKSIGSTIEDYKKGILSLEETYDRLTTQMHKKDGSLTGHFGKMDESVKNEILDEYAKIQKEMTDLQNKELKAQEAQQQEFDAKWLASQEARRKQAIADQNAQTDAINKAVQEQGEKKMELLALEQKVDEARKNASKTISEYQSAYGDFIDPQELRKIQLGFNEIAVDTQGLTTNVKETEAQLKQLSKALEDAGKNAKKLQDKDTQSKEKEYEKEFQKLLKEEETMARKSVEFEKWKNQQIYNEAKKKNEKLKALEQSYENTKKDADSRIVDVKYDLRGFIDEAQLDEIQEAMKQIDVQALGVDHTVEEINQQITYWKNHLNEVVEKAEQAKKAQYELGAQMAKDVEREIAISDQKEKVEKRIADLKNSALRTDDEALDRLAEQLENVDYRSLDAERSIRRINESVSELESEAQQASRQVSTLGDVIKNQLARISVDQVFDFTKDAIKEMVQQVIALDDALVELQKVSDLSGDSLKSFTADAFEVSNTVGQLGSDVVQSTADFKKMGYTVEEALKLAESAMVYSNVGDNVSPDDATSTLISTMKAFNVEAKDSIQIIDKINAVSNNFAITSEGLGAALQRSASSLMEANNSLDQTLALYAVGNQITQDPETVSNGLKTISMRLRGVDEDTGKLIPKFRDLFLEYSNGRVDIMNTNDEFKSTFEIIRDLGKEWDNLTDVQQAKLAELSAGKNRANIFMSLMSSAEDLEKALDVSTNSMGSAMAENERAMDSITGKINQMKSAFQELAINTISSDFVKGIVDLMTALLNLADKIGVVNLALIAFGGYLALSKSAFALGIINKLGYAFIDLGTKIGSATIAQLGLNTAFLAFAPMAIVAGIVAVVKAFDAFIVSAEEQRQKVEELQGSYNELQSELEQLKSKAEPTESDKQRIELLEMEARATQRLIEENEKLLMQKEILGKDWNPFTKGVLGDTDYSLDFDIEPTLEAIKNVQAEIDNLISSGASEEAILRQSEHLQSLKDNLVGFVPDLTQAYTKLQNSLKYATDEEKKQIQATLDRLDVLLPEIKAVTNLTDANEDLANSNKDVANSTKDASLVMQDFRDEEARIKEETSKLADEYIELVDTIKQVQEGKALTLAQAKDIVDKYGLEYSSIIQVADGYSIELGALNNLKNNKLSDLNNMSQAENVHKNEAIKAIMARVQAVDVEIDSYEKLLQAKQKVAGTIRELESKKGTYQNPLSQFGISNSYLDRKMGEQMDGFIDQLIADQQADLDILNQGIDDLNEIKNSQRDGQEKLQSLLGGYSGTLTPSQQKKDTSKSSSKSQSYISRNLDVLIDDILKKGDELAYAMELTNLKIENAIAKGDEKTEIALREKLVGQLQERVKATHETANKLRAEGENLIKTLSSTGLFKGKDLKQLTEKQLADVVRALDVKIANSTDSQAESLNLLKGKVEEYGNAIIRIYRDEIPTLSQQWWELENERIQANIELLDERYELQKRGTENALRDIELQQMLLDSDSEKYIELEKKKLDEILKAQRDTYEVIKKLKEMGYSDEDEQVEKYLSLWYNYEKEKRQMMLDSAKDAQKLREEELKKEQDGLKDKQEALNDIIEATIKLIKQEANERKNALQEELKGYKKIIDAKKESLEQEKDDRKDAKELEEKKKKVSEIEKKILELQFDTSAKATAERLKLEEELQEAREDLEDYQFEQSIDKQQEALDKEYEQFEENINKQIDAIEDYLSKEGALRQEALDRIAKDNKLLYEQLLDWNRQYGTGVDEDITKAWELATDAMEEFNNGQLSVLDTLDLIEQKMKAINDEIDNMKESNGLDYTGGQYGDIYDKPEDMDAPTKKPEGEEYQKLIDKIAPQMNRNSDAWWKTDDPAEKDRLAKENQELAKKIGAYQRDGHWVVMSNGKVVKLKDLYPEYHTGGIVGGEPKLKSTEEFAKLLKGEVVVTQNQMDKFMRVTMPSMINTPVSTGGSIKIEKLFDLIVEGNLDSSVMPRLEELTKQLAPRIAETLNQSIFNKGFKKPI